MKLLALLIVLGVEHFWSLGRYVRRDNWFMVLQSWTDHNVLDPAARYLCAAVAPAFVVAMMVWVLKNQFWGVLGFLLDVFILFYVIGRGQLTQSVENYLSNWRTGDLQGAVHEAEIYFGIDQNSVNNGVELHHMMRSRVLYLGLTDFFVVIFWYLLLGVLGAMIGCLTRLYVLNATGEAKQWAQKAQHVIDWMPSRLLGLTFAVAGNFGTCFGEWIEYIGKTKMSNIDFLSVCGVSAIGLTEIIEDEETKNGEPSRDYLYKAEQEIRALLALIERSRYVWFAIIAVAIVLGWL